jgi:hypothetical protein
VACRFQSRLSAGLSDEAFETWATGCLDSKLDSDQGRNSDAAAQDQERGVGGLPLNDRSRMINWEQQWRRQPR